MTQTLHYPSKAMLGDYLRAAFGLTLTGTPIMLSGPGSATIWVLGPLALLFAIFGARTALRHRTTVELDDTGVVVHGLRAQRLAWGDLKDVRLNYYSTKRDRGQGWMQLVLRGSDAKLRFDSTLEGFPEVAKRAYTTAKAKGVELTEATISNFAALGFEPPKTKD